MKAAKKLVIVLLALCLGLFAVGCGGGSEDSGKITYTLKITCDSADVLAGVTVKLTDFSGNDVTGGGKKVANGQVKFDLEPGTYFAVLDGLPDNYSLPEIMLTQTIRSTDISLKADGSGGDEKVAVKFKLKVLYPDETPVTDVSFNMCVYGDTGSCTPAVTGSDGVAAYNLYEGKYELHINSQCPEGYVFDNGLHVIDVNAGNTSQTVKLEVTHEYTVSVFNAETYDDNGNRVERSPASGVTVTLTRKIGSEEASEPSFTGTTNSQGVATIVAAGGSGAEYRLGLANLPEGCDYYEKTLILTPNSNTNPREDVGELTIVRLGAEARAAKPLPVGNTTVQLTKSMPEVFYMLEHGDRGGTYSIVSSGSVDSHLVYFSGTGVNNFRQITESDYSDVSISGNDGVYYRDDKDSTDKNFRFEFRIDPEYVYGQHANKYVFRMSAASGVSLPASFTVSVTLENEEKYTPIPDTHPKASGVKQAIATPQGSIHYANAQTDTFVKDGSGLYHLGAADGPIIFVPISGSTYGVQNFGGGEEGNVSFSVAFNESGGTGFSVSDGETYRRIYDVFIASYVAAANEDGLTPFTDELKEYFQAIAHSLFVPQVLGWDSSSEKLYMFGCCYFA